MNMALAPTLTRHPKRMVQCRHIHMTNILSHPPATDRILNHTPTRTLVARSLGFWMATWSMRRKLKTVLLCKIHTHEASVNADCSGSFFTQYHTLIPILDPTLSPNEYYDLSPFLFWSIIVTGSRRYTEDPTILDKTSQLITPLAFSSMALRSTPIPVIQGLLILCTWRLPTNSMYKDMTHVLCGAAVHLATQIGLHVAGVGQDFARMPLKKDDDQKMLRAKLWMYCVLVSIR
jgi:hypothetical protein